MKKLLVVKLEGINYYTFAGCKLVNMTCDEITNENCETVNSFNCFTCAENIPHTEALEVEVMDFVADNKLQDVILPELSKVTDSNTARIGRQRAIRENFVLANFDSLEVEGNTITIYSKSDDCDGISIDFRNDPKTIGNIVG